MTASTLDFHQASVARLQQAAGTGDEWLRLRREEAFQRFVDAGGFPSTRHEEWRQTNLASLARTDFALAPEDAPRPTQEELLRWMPGLADLAPGRIVLFNGVVADELSRPHACSAGETVASLREARRDGRPELERFLGLLAPRDDRPVRDFAASLADDGVFVHVPRNVKVELPIVVVSIAAARSEPSVSAPRVLAVLEEGAEATIVEVHVGRDEGTHLTTAVTEASLAASARLSHVQVVQAGGGGQHLGTVAARVARDASFQSAAFALGGQLIRIEVDAVLEGEGASADLDGAYVVSGKEQADCRTFVDHAVPHCESRQLYKGVLGGASRGVFSGMVLVRPDAQKTVAHQTNRNLILSDDALADTRPQLEIHADDVKCTHGATIGRLDESQLFYLRSRGIPALEARGMLVSAFAREIVSHGAASSAEDFVAPLLDAAMSRAVGEPS